MPKNRQLRLAQSMQLFIDEKKRLLNFFNLKKELSKRLCLFTTHRWVMCNYYIKIIYPYITN